MKLARALPCTALGLVSAVVHAADALPPSPVSFSGLLQVLLGLALVIAAIVATGWLLRRLGPSQAAGGLLRVVGGVMVGPRERLGVVEVGEQWLIVGVAAGSVNLLHALPKGAGGTGAPVPPGAGAPDAAWLRRLLAGGGQTR
jgi:flagellar protein FliO/FliZ